MKILTLMIALLMAGTFVLTAAVPIVKSVDQVTRIEQGQYYFPVFSPAGDRLYFTTANYNGLFYTDLADKSISRLNNLPGAGYEPVFAPDGSMVWFRTFTYKKRLKYSSIMSQDVISGTQKTIITDRREISTPRLDENANLIFLDQQTVQSQQTSVKIKSSVTTSSLTNSKNVFIENTAIVMIESGNKKILNPMGEGHYIWPSVSPDGTRLLFTKLGAGTFISDLDGQNSIPLGMANAPKWSPDGKWVCYMVEKDDGYVVTESELYVVSSDGNQKFKLTDTDSRIEMYPVWGADNSKIAFATDNGEIFIMHLEYK